MTWLVQRGQRRKCSISRKCGEQTKIEIERSHCNTFLKKETEWILRNEEKINLCIGLSISPHVFTQLYLLRVKRKWQCFAFKQAPWEGQVNTHTHTCTAHICQKLLRERKASDLYASMWKWLFLLWIFIVWRTKGWEERQWDVKWPTYAQDTA